MTTINKFFERIDKTKTCWLWTAAKLKAGYGVMRLNGKTVYAHRLSYEIHIGPIPEGLQIDHLCRIRHCCNPSHLEAVTQYVNLSRGDGIGAMNARKTHCPSGHEYSKKNTYWYNGGRLCRICRSPNGRKK